MEKNDPVSDLGRTAEEGVTTDPTVSCPVVQGSCSSRRFGVLGRRTGQTTHLPTSTERTRPRRAVCASRNSSSPVLTPLWKLDAMSLDPENRPAPEQDGLGKF